MEINKANIKIKIFLKENKGNLLANANITINTVDFGYLTLKGFQIWRSSKFNGRLQEAINITPPRKRVFGSFSNLIFLNDENKWHILENYIYEAFKKAQSNKKEKEVLNEDINPDEIPI